jgi:hypothetical protein
MGSLPKIIVTAKQPYFDPNRRNMILKIGAHQGQRNVKKHI